jgi:hypothetical protein
MLDQFSRPTMYRLAFERGMWTPVIILSENSSNIKIEFVHSTENDSDIFTKNASKDIYERHAKKFLADSRMRYRMNVTGCWRYPLRLSALVLICLGYPLGINFLKNEVA